MSRPSAPDIFGELGNDTLRGGTGNDTLTDTQGPNTLFDGGSGTNTCTGTSTVPPMAAVNCTVNNP